MSRRNANKSVSTRAAPRPEHSVLRWAVASRLFVVALQAIVVVCVPPYDTSRSLVPRGGGSAAAPSGGAVRLLDGLSNWDGLYFLGLAEGGYETEKVFAFQPGLTFLLRAAVGWLPTAQRHVACVVAGVFVANAAFVAAALVLFHLGVAVMGPRAKGAAFVGALLFCVNPASVFFSAVYTESPYALCSFSGMLCVSRNRKWAAALLFAAACSLRANGVVAAGFLLHAHAQEMVRHPSAARWARTVTVAALQTAVVAAPFLAFQAHAYGVFCGAGAPDATGRRTAPDEPRWCGSTPPLVYTHVQAEYWGSLGFLGYFQLRQLPNFALAAPILAISWAAVWDYIRERSDLLPSLGLAISGDPAPSPRSGWHSPGVFVHCVYLLGLSLLAFTAMHVQVSTRFLCSSCPAVYWYMARLAGTGTGTGGSASGFRGVVGYCLVYAVVGTVLFSAFYPWT